MPRPVRILELAFARRDALRHEYEANLANGGVFVASQESFELREKVRVRLVLAFCHQQLELAGEVVHQVSAEMAAIGGGPRGVAISFDEPAAKIRARLAPLLDPAPTPPPMPLRVGQKPRAPRASARVAARIEGSGEPVAGSTRNLSQTGALVSVPGRGLPVGERVKIQLRHPTGAAMEVEGTVVREVAGEGGPAAVAIRFDPSQSRRAEVESFVEGVQSAEHVRRLGGISGDVAELGVGPLLQMLGSTAAAGTVVLRRGVEEAAVGFEGGMIRFARLGAATGMKALVRLVGWRDGSFEYHARLDAPGEISEPPMPLEAAVLDASLMHDELGRPGRRLPGPDVVPRLAAAAAASAGADLGKLERAVLDLVQAGFPVRRILEVIPEPDPSILGALEALADAGLVRL